jgi:NAD(P)H dehydrogenase (quinone)
MYVHVKVALFYYGVSEQVYRLAVAATGGAWDAGGEVRVCRIREPVPPETTYARPAWIEILRDFEGVPEASPADLEWADVALFGTATPYNTVADGLSEFIHATVPLWRAGKLAEKVYGAFTSAATVRCRRDGRLVLLDDVFHHWGGIVVPLRSDEATSPEAGRPGAPSREARRSTRGSPTETELAAARDQGQRATETARALQAGRRVLADVA